MNNTFFLYDYTHFVCIFIADQWIDKFGNLTHIQQLQLIVQYLSVHVVEHTFFRTLVTTSITWKKNEKYFNCLNIDYNIQMNCAKDKD